MGVPADCEEDDLPLASRGSVKVFGLISVGVKPPHGSTCGAGWEPEKKRKKKRNFYHEIRNDNDKRELHARHEEVEERRERGLKCGPDRFLECGGETTGHIHMKLHMF